MSFVSPVLAAKPTGSGKPSRGGGDGGTTATPLGNDVSYPQCGRKLPNGQAFGIVGVNGGLANLTNDCLAQQLAWAAQSVGGATQDKIQLYVNTANPGEVIDQITTWPANNTDPQGNVAPNPYGVCDHTNSLACSWQYGWNRAVEDVHDRFMPAAGQAGISQEAGQYRWWLDVETMNTWQQNSTNKYALNAATLEGMTAYFKSNNARVGLYSTAVQWSEIAGNELGITGNLSGLPNWRPSGSNLNNAKANCSVAPLTPGGWIELTQFISHRLDYNYSCNN